MNLVTKYSQTKPQTWTLYGCETWSLILREERRLRMFENMVSRRIFGPKRDEVTGEWRKLYEELNGLYSSSNVVRFIKSRRLRWAGHVACMGKGRGVYRVLVGKLREGDQWGDPGIGERIVLKWIYRKWDVGFWTGSVWLRIGTGGGHL
jgi:hypothetical protein